MTLVLGALVFAGLLAAAAGLHRNTTRPLDRRWAWVVVVFGGNLLLVLSSGTLPGLAGAALMATGLVALLVSTRRGGRVAR